MEINKLFKYLEGGKLIMVKTFDTKTYIDQERKEIMRRIRKFKNKLYFEFGGKLLDDHHAERVLPGFELDAKLQLFQSLKEQMELVICINSDNIQNERIRSDYDTLYIDDCLKLIDSYRRMGFLISGIAFTLFKEQPRAKEFALRLQDMGEKVYFLKYIPNYPNDFNIILDSFEQSDFIETTRPLVVMTSSGSASGKLSACLCQVYKEHKLGNQVGYAKYDLFPVWDLPISHPLNIAFEAATADSGDEILVDTFYYEKTHQIASNYNRDFSVFPVIREILRMTTGGKDIYDSPTEMVVNTMSSAIQNDEIIRKKGKEEVCRRYLTYWKQFIRGQSKGDPIVRVSEIMKKNHITMEDLAIVPISRCFFQKHKDSKCIVLELKENEFVFAIKSKKLTIGASLLRELFEKEGLIEKKDYEVFVNSFKGKIDIRNFISFLKSSESNKMQEYTNVLGSLVGCNAHVSYVIDPDEEKQIKSLGIYLTCEPNLES